MSNEFLPLPPLRNWLPGAHQGTHGTHRNAGEVEENEGPGNHGDKRAAGDVGWVHDRDPDTQPDQARPDQQRDADCDHGRARVKGCWGRGQPGLL